MGRISPGPTRWPPGAERRLVPAKSNLKPQTSNLPMLIHIVRYEREEVGFFMILSGGRGPEILAASTPFLRGADRVTLDLSVLAIFPMTSMSTALSILHVGLDFGVELQLHRDVLQDLVQAHAGEDDLHPQRLSAPPLRVVEAH